MGLMDVASSLTSGSAPTYANDSFLASGQLEKAKLVAHKEPLPSSPQVDPGEIEFFLNPASVKVKKSVKIEQTPNTGTGTNETRAANTHPIDLTIDKLWFDTYESRKNVRKEYIDKLEKLLDYVEGTHYPPAVMFLWGKFTEESDHSEKYMFYVESLDVNYTMFLPDGTPVRAEVTIALKQCLMVAEQPEKESPDHAKLYTVRRGDTLQAIAQREYDDPREWRRIAKTNNIGDPMSLRPGTKLLVPPIL
jgi:nucleoid-associated protein YgaU